MKRFLTSVALALASFSPTLAENKVLPIASDELIDSAPEGTVVSDAQRSGYSYYYSSGTVLGGYNSGFVGEYVIGTDGSIYIKNICASLKTNTYLKLDKVDDENYVAHTAQLIYVDNSGSSPYLAFAVRLVYTKVDDNTYSYQVETDADGKSVTDIKFSFKDGVLQQVDQEIIDMNGQKLPHELIGMTNSTGGWIGYGDGAIVIKSSEFVATELPKDAVVKDASFVTCALSSMAGSSHKLARLTKYAEVGDEYYVEIPGHENAWVKGSIDRSANTVTFKRQYVGINEELECHQWFTPVTYKDEKEIWDDETGYGVWYRNYEVADALVLKYVDGSVVSDETQKVSGAINISSTELQVNEAFSNMIIKPYVFKMAQPAKPTVVMVEEFNGFYGSMLTALPNVDVNDVYINPDELSYVVFLGDDTKPYELTPDKYMELTENMTEIPFTYDDDIDIDYMGAFHNLYYYDDFPYVGVQVIYRHDGEELRSEVAWYNHDVSPVKGIVNDIENGRVVKSLENGRMVIVKDGKKYNITGSLIR